MMATAHGSNTLVSALLRDAGRPRPRPRNADALVPHPTVIPPGVRVAADLVYRTASSRNGEVELVMDLFLPAQARPGQRVPVALWCHGGAWIEGTRSDLALHWLPTRGYAMASIEYRFSHDATFPAQLHDVKAAVRWLRAHADEYHLDSRRIVAAGASAGGQLAALLGTTAGMPEAEGDGPHREQTSDVAAVVNLFGPTDLLGHAATGYPVERPGSPVEALLGGPVTRKRDLAHLASAIEHIRGHEPPFLTIHGLRDPIVPVRVSQRLHDKLQQAGGDSTLLLVDGGHGEPWELFLGGEPMRRQVEAFLARTVGPPPFPGKL